MDHRTRIFASVFPVPSLSHTTPTPIATPDLSYIAPGQSFGGAFGSNVGGGDQHRAVRRNIAWSTATRFLSLPKPLVGLSASSSSIIASFEAQKERRGTEIQDALQYLLVGEGRSEDDDEEGLVEWYTNEARLNFANHVRPALVQLWQKEIELNRAWDVLRETQRILQQVQDVYMQPFNDHILPVLAQGVVPKGRATRSAQVVEQKDTEQVNAKFRRDLHALFVHCLPQQRVSKTLSYVLYDAGCRIFRIYVRQDGVQSSTAVTPKETQQHMVTLLQGLERVGLGGDFAQKAFAHAMDKLMDSFITSHYLKVDWHEKKPMVPHLRSFIKDGFCPLVELVMQCLRSNTTIQPTEVQSWQDMALGRLGRARVDTLFDFVINWNESLGAVLDIKVFCRSTDWNSRSLVQEYLKVPGAKQHLTSSFAQQISRRLLHAGATTTYILNVYIRIVRAFHELEPKGVLLERVARPIRRYLKERDDTARIIISSLLTDLSDESGSKFNANSELSFEIASEMQNPSGNNFSQEADEELNYNDMNWQPLPTDASPEYKKTKTEDVVWFLLTLWDREDFISELKNILGDHLLRCQDPHFEKEIRLLELIKVRLGDDKLQACEVMLRDVLESKRINTAIHASVTLPRTPSGQLPETPDNPGPAPRTPRPRRPTTSASSLLPPATPSTQPPSGPQLNAQIISSFFWPLLRDDHFLVPTEIQNLQKEYESRFERIKGMRKLRWMNALGDGTVTLELEDRTEEFTGLMPWQVSVIYAFQPQPGEEWAAGGNNKPKSKTAKSPSITRNVTQLEEMLQMDESLVRQSLSFWIGQSVLRETDPDTFTVIETQTSASVDTDAAAAAQELAEVQAQAQAGAVRSQADLLAEKKDVFCSFIMGMLTNQGNLPAARILMMLRMMAGYTFGNEELGWLLEGLEKEDKIVSMGGDVWGIRK